MQLTTTNRGFAPTTLTEAMTFSDMLANSSMVPRAYQGKPQDILVCVQWGMEMGLAPMQALQNIAVINGKPSVYGDALMALVQASPVCEDIEEFFEGEGTPNPVAVCVAKRKGRKPVTARFSVEDAKRAGLWAKQGPWTAYPKRMMQMRARGFALRDAFPDVLKGMITAEEAQDYQEETKPRQVANLAKPANPLDMIAPAPMIEQTSNPAVIEAAFAYDQEADTVNELVAQAKADSGESDFVLKALSEASAFADKMVERFEVLNIPEVAEQAPTGELFAVLLPGKDKPHSMHGTLEEWQDAYEAVAEKTAMATKVPARERMTKLRELRELNEPTIGKVEMIARIRHTAAYSKRLHALGAAQ
jgi:hypothetical protein